MLKKFFFGLLAITLLSLPISFSAYGKVDYKDCIKFTNPFTFDPEAPSDGAGAWGGGGVISNGGIGTGGYGGGLGGGFFGGTAMGYLPFDLQPDGKIKPHKEIESYNVSKDGRQEVITYEMDIFSGNKLLPGEKPDPGKFNQTTEKEFTVVVNRDEQGNITSIVQNNSVSKKEIAKHNKYVEAWYDFTYSKEYKEASKKSGYDKFQQKGQAPFMVPLKTTTGFKMTGDDKLKTCVPTGQKTDWLLEAKEGGFTYKTTNFDTKFCSDLNTLLKDKTVNSDLKSCYRKSTNNKFAKFFGKYASDNFFANFNGGYGAPGTGIPGTGIGGGFNFPGLSPLNHSLDAKISSYAFPANRQPSGEPLFYSLPHVAQAAQLVNQCRGIGLGPFLGEYFWKDDDIQAAEAFTFGGGKDE
ncbi:MAG: hypothetical protein HOM21_06255 [Halobacteriovoraceae bacterium]|jgi:hypothetical protein|nr:hypothetical protein [Halobacteriovoraceae bacterium]